MFVTSCWRLREREVAAVPTWTESHLRGAPIRRLGVPPCGTSGISPKPAGMSGSWGLQSVFRNGRLSETRPMSAKGDSR
jgi:hypothetical protein